jgi:hypothetical protein
MTCSLFHFERFAQRTSERNAKSKTYKRFEVFTAVKFQVEVFLGCDVV